MSKDPQIGWQKYEDMLESQINSPIMMNIYNNFTNQMMASLTDEELDQLEEMGEMPNTPEEMGYSLPITSDLAQNINLASNFDCWMGHTNFNITHGIREKINKAEGVEILKVVSRYRFFLGIGRMFDFKDVRTNIENIIKGE